MRRLCVGPRLLPTHHVLLLNLPYVYGQNMVMDDSATRMKGDAGGSKWSLPVGGTLEVQAEWLKFEGRWQANICENDLRRSHLFPCAACQGDTWRDSGC